MGCGHDRVAGVRDKWHARVGDDEDEAGTSDVDKLLRPVFLIVIEIGHDLATNLRAERCGERTGPARVLGSDDISALKSLHETWRRIADIAQRSGGDKYACGDKRIIHGNQLKHDQ